MKHTFITDANAGEHITHIVRELKRTLQERGKAKVVLGLSGGLDSAVCAAIAVKALGSENVRAISLPYGRRANGRYTPSSRASEDDAAASAASLGLELETVDIAHAVDALATSLGLGGLGLNATLLDSVGRVVLGNTKARIRAVVLRGMANHDSETLVLGTENRTEHYLGYFTIGGDEQSDIEVLPRYYKTEVRAMARALGVPQAILDKAPSADLWEGQTDEAEIGVTYADVDLVLACTSDGKEPNAPCPVDPHLTRRVLERVRATSYKRATKPCASRPEAL